MDKNTIQQNKQLNLQSRRSEQAILATLLASGLSACGGGGGTNSSSGSNNSNPSTISSIDYSNSINSRELEPNNTMITANYANNMYFVGQTYSSSDLDFYYINQPNWNQIDVKFTSDHFGTHQVTTIDSKGYIISSKKITYEDTFNSSPYHSGGMLILVQENSVSGFYDDDDYTIIVSEGTSTGFENEPNNFMNDADNLISASGRGRIGQSSSEDDKDYYGFTAENNTEKIIFTSDHFGYHKISILDSSSNILASKRVYEGTDTITVSTIPGNAYYVLVQEDSSSGFYDDDNYLITIDFPTIPPPLAVFKEQHSPETSNDYDWVVLDTDGEIFSLHIENSNFFDSVYDQINYGSARKLFSISYGKINSEDHYTDYNWIEADSITTIYLPNSGPEGIGKMIIVQDETIKDIVINNEYGYIKFGILTDDAWVMDHFAVADVELHNTDWNEYMVSEMWPLV